LSFFQQDIKQRVCCRCLAGEGLGGIATWHEN